MPSGQRASGSLTAATLLLFLALPSGPARAESIFWTTDETVGPSRFDLTLDIDCVGNFICPFVDGYSSTRTPVLTGEGVGTLSAGGDFAFVPDRFLAAVIERVWAADAEDFAFDPIPLVGTPTVTNAAVFGSTGGPFAIPGLGFGAFGPVPIGETLMVGERFDLDGLGSPMPNQVAGPLPEPVSGVFEMLDNSRFEVRDLVWSLVDSSEQDLAPGTLTVTTTGEVRLNLAGLVLLELSVERDELVWTATGDDAYDVVRGGLGLLRSGAGDFTGSVEACLAEDQPTAQLPYTLDPPPGTGHWFLVRRVTPLGPRTYDLPFPTQQTPRDTPIDLAPGACL